MAGQNTKNNSIIDYRTLRAQKELLGLQNDDIARATGYNPATVSAFLCGKQAMYLETIVNLARALHLRPRIIFEPIETETAQTVELKAA